MITQIKNDIKQAMKDKDKVKLSTLRMLLSTIETERSKKVIESVEDFSNDDIIGLINRNIKSINQEIDSLISANRDYSKQEQEKLVLLSYLPKQLTTEEVLNEIAHAIKLVENGEVKNPMQYLSQKLKGKTDMKTVSNLLKEISAK